jgi:competence protein ComEC
VVLSHPDADHLMGLVPLFKNFQVKELWHSGFDSSHPLMARLIEAADEQKTRLRSISELPDRLALGGATIELLSPKGETNTAPKIASTNNLSLVLRVSYKKHSILFPGDIEEERELELLSKQVDLQASVVKAPHHGSKTSSGESFVRATHARHVVFCTGVNNRFGFPHADVVARWQQNGAVVWNTATNGETTFHIGSETLEVRPFIATSEDQS